MNNMVQWAMQMIQANGIQGTGETQEMINAIQNNDEKAGVALANKILQQAGVSREQGLQQARQYFHIPMGK